MDRHYATALDLDQLAAVAGISKFHFANWLVLVEPRPFTPADFR
jgi:hypothetical protein